MGVCPALHVIFSTFLALLVGSAVTTASSYLRAYGAKELWPYLRLRCDLRCPYGYETDIEGNLVCLCHDPCQNVLCFGRTRCVVELPKLCTRDYCRPRATCRDTGPLLPLPPSHNGVFLADDASTTSSATSIPARCRLPRSGAADKSCRKLRVRWFFDDVTGTCRSFLGCRTTGNNNFRGRRGCEKTCSLKTGNRNKHGPNSISGKPTNDVTVTSHRHYLHVPPAPLLCSRPVAPPTSRCQRSAKRWLYDGQSGSCRKFRVCPSGAYGFRRKRDCRHVCQDPGRARRRARRNQSRAANQ
ncbi:uncharacterized protein LOC143281603 [Babylonia areolata]|uniref:uncharacterized protein LOC143281603 n=1 Tax=Babylonia areolata TaxID=304850 RepID=UPI003FD56A78